MPNKHMNTTLAAKALASAGDAIVVTDHNMGVLIFNHEAERLFGYPAAEMAGQPLARLIPERYHDIHQRHVARFTAAAEESIVMHPRAPVRGRKSTGEEFFIEVTISKIHEGDVLYFLAIIRDGSQRQQELNNLRLNTERLAKAQGIAQLGNWEWELPDGLLYWSDTLYSIFGVDKETFGHSYESFLSLVHPDDRPLVQDSVSQALQTGTPYDIEHRIIHPNGAEHFVHEQGIVEFDMEGKPLRMIGTCQSITERKLIEGERARHHEIQKILNALLSLSLQDLSLTDKLAKCIEYITSLPTLGILPKGAIFTVDPEENILILQAYRNLHEALLTKCATVTFGHCLCGKAAATKHTVFADCLDHRHDNTYAGILPHGHYCIPIINSQGSLMGVFTVYTVAGTPRDARTEEILFAAASIMASIIERQRFQDALRVSEERFREMADLLPQTIFELDAAGRITYVNRFATALTGYGLEELQNKAMEQLLPHDQRERFHETISGIMADSMIKVREHTLVRRDNGTVTVLVYARSIIHGEQKAGIRGILVDISDRKDAEEKIKQLNQELEGRVAQRTEQLEAANQALVHEIEERKQIATNLALAKKIAEDSSKAKSEFLANMSHEIRTPMNAIIGLSHLAMSGQLPPDTLEYLEKIHHSAHSLLGIVNDVLDFSKVEADQMRLDTVEFFLEDVLNNVSTLLGVSAAKKRLEFILDQGHDLPLTLVGDPVRLRQVLVNLTNNAMKFTERGEVVLSCSVAHRTREQITICFSVQDTGIGIAPDTIAAIFEPFSQGDTSTTRKFGGTGLGLTIANKFARMMGGSIEVESTPGHGSTFSFKAVFALPPKEEEALAPPEDLRGIPVLIATENKTIRQVLESALRSLAFKPHCIDLRAPSLDDALTQIAGHERPFQLLLLECEHMAAGNAQASELLRQVTAHIPLSAIILISGYYREQAMETARELGVQRYLYKPVLRTLLFNALMAVFGKAQARSRFLGSTKETSNGDDRLSFSGARVLVAEDNEINQEVATKLLKQWKISTELAKNGREAVTKAQTGDFSLVLMDIQMPELDGYGATEEIRTWEQTRPQAAHSGDTRLPIVAMTAHAMSGDREKCLAAGMDDYITKPLNPHELLTQLLKWLQADAATAPATPPESLATEQETPERDSLPELDGIDSKTGAARVGGDIQTYRALLQKFATNQGGTMAKIKAALTSDPAQARRLLHTLKGVAGNIGAMTLYHHVHDLESAIKEDDLEAINQKLTGVEGSLAVVLASIASIPAARQENNLATDRAVDQEALTAFLAKLTGLLNDNDTDALHYLGEMKDTLLNKKQVLDLRRVETLIKAYDFDGALTELHEIAGAWNIVREEI